MNVSACKSSGSHEAAAVKDNDDRNVGNKWIDRTQTSLGKVSDSISTVRATASKLAFTNSNGASEKGEKALVTQLLPMLRTLSTALEDLNTILNEGASLAGGGSSVVVAAADIDRVMKKVAAVTALIEQDLIVKAADLTTLNNERGPAFLAFSASLDKVEAGVDEISKAIGSWSDGINSKGDGTPSVAGQVIVADKFFLKTKFSTDRAATRTAWEQRCAEWKELVKSLFPGTVDTAVCGATTELPLMPGNMLNSNFGLAAKPVLTVVVGLAEKVEPRDGDEITTPFINMSSFEDEWVNSCFKFLKAAKAEFDERLVAADCGTPKIVEQMPGNMLNDNRRMTSNGRLWLAPPGQTPSPAGSSESKVRGTVSQNISVDGFQVKSTFGTNDASRARFDALCTEWKALVKSLFAPAIDTAACGTPASVPLMPGNFLNSSFAFASKPVVSMVAKVPAQIDPRPNEEIATNFMIKSVFEEAWTKACFAYLKSAKAEFGARFIAADCGTPQTIEQMPGNMLNDNRRATSIGRVWLLPF